MTSGIMERPRTRSSSKTDVAAFDHARSYALKFSNLNRFVDRSPTNSDEINFAHMKKLIEIINDSQEYPKWFTYIVELSNNSQTARRAKIEAFKAFTSEPISEIKKILEVVRINELDTSFIVTLGMASISVKKQLPDDRYSFCRRALTELENRGLKDPSINNIFSD